MTVLQLMKASYRLLMGDDEPSTDNLNNGFLALNALLNEWSTRRYGIYKVSKESFSLVKGTAEYSIGPGETFNTTRPIRILDSFIRGSDGTDYEMEEIDRKWYNNKSRKTTEGIPYELYYEPTFPNGTISIYYAPDEAYTLYMDSEKALAQYTALTNDLSLPPEYETALKFNFAIDWANELGVEPSQVVVARAQITLDNLKALHAIPIPMVRSNPINNNRGGLNNIYGDGSF